MNRKYPAHFYEPIRIEIAVSQIQHDFRKLFPSLNSKQWPKIDKDISEWFLGEKFELEPAHDFWNIFGGFARGLKLKSLLSWVTAENVVWAKKDVPVSKIEITWDFPGLEFMGKAPHKAKDIIEKLNSAELKETKEKLKRDSIERSNKYSPRDDFPIMLFDDPKGEVIGVRPGFYVLEGNRRTVKAIVNDFETLSAYVGKFKDPKKDYWPDNYWLQTGILRDLIFLSVGYNKGKDQGAFDLTRKFYQLLLRDFDIARIATIDKTFKNFERNEKFLLDIMLEDLK